MYSHCGGRPDEVGYAIDCVNAVEPIIGSRNELIDNGVVRLQLNESGGESTAASSVKPFVNTAADVGGFPAHGRVTILTQASSVYHGANFFYGDATPDKRLI